MQCDLRAASVADLEHVVAQIVAELGRLDILVNTVGVIFLSQAAARVMMRQGGGKIINRARLGDR